MNIAIIDDQQIDREIVVSCLKLYFSRGDNNLLYNISEFESGNAFLKIFYPGGFDIILIDFYMNGISGMETARKIRQFDNSVILIFITNSRDYAIEGYTVMASGYLLKPMQYNKFVEIMSRIDINLINSKKYIEFNSRCKTVRFFLHDIIYCDIEGHYVRFHTGSMGLNKNRMTFSDLLLLLKPHREFLNCFRGCVINMNHIKKVRDFTFCMDNGDRIPYRVKEQSKLMKAYTDYLFESVREKKYECNTSNSTMHI